MRRRFWFLLCLILLSAQLVYAQDISTGLVGWWRLDEGTGTSTTADSSGNSNTGTLVGSPAWSTPGKIGPYGLNLSTNAMSVDVTQSSSINSLASLTAAAWINVTTVFNSGLAQRVFYKDAAGWNLRIGSATSGALTFGANRWTAAGTWDSVGLVTVSTWQHVAVTYSHSSTANVPIFYINGVATTNTAATQPTGVTSTETGTLVLGNRTADRTISGIMDDVRLYNRVLTATDIATLYSYRSGAKQQEGRN